MKLSTLSAYKLPLGLIVLALLVGLILTPAYPLAQAEPSPSPAKPRPAPEANAKASSPDKDDLSELKDRLKAMEERERQTYAQLLDSRSKTIDWWFAFLAVFTAVIGVGGALIPFLLGRKDKEAIEADMRAIQADKDAIHSDKQIIQSNKAEIEQLHQTTLQKAARISVLEKESAKGAESIQETLKTLHGYTPTGTQNPLSDQEKNTLQAAAKAVETSKEATFAEQLLARAVDAETKEDFAKAKNFWTALTEENPNHARAWFGLGYALQSLAHEAPENALSLLKEAGAAYQKTLELKPSEYWAANNWGIALSREAQVLAPDDLPEARRLWQQAYERYAQALALKPDKHEAANNWGSALSLEALALALTDLPEARRLWQQAHERYAQAITLKPDMHEAANNWGSALNNEALALAPTDLPEARRLWQQAHERYAQAITLKPDMHEAANNWGSALNNEALALARTDLPEARRLWQQAYERYAQALALKPDMHEAAYNWGLTLSKEAQALAPADLPEARRLWQQAHERYAQALALKPDMHEAADNWGNALLHEFQAIKTKLPQVAQGLLAQAEEKCLLAENIKPGFGAYNLACVAGLRCQAEECVRWLETASHAENFPPPDHIRADPDLAPIRQTPEFRAWWAITFGPDEALADQGPAT